MQSDALQNIKTYEGWAEDFYEPLAVRHYDRAIERMLRMLSPSPGSEVLDAGCGTGVHSVRVASHGYWVRAIDISPVAIDQARQLAQFANAGNRIRFERADLTRLPFDDDSFETIFSWGVVIHIHDIEASLRELVRVLKPGGRIALQVTNSSAIDYKLESIARRLLRQPKANAEMTQYGFGAWDEGDVGRLWTVQTRIRQLVHTMSSLGCEKRARIASEFTELQRHFRGPARTALRLLNRVWFAWRLPAWPACTNIIVFQKEN